MKPTFALRHLATLALLLAALAAPAGASLLPAVPAQTSGTGLGAVNTVLTFQADGTESGCVSWDGSMVVTGPAACPSGIAGGDEQAANNAPTIGELGLSSAFNLRVVFNISESNDVDITLGDLRLRIFAPGGAVLFDSGPFAPQTFPEHFSGTGNSGFVFRLDAAQALAAEEHFAPLNRIGLAATASGSDNGLETFYVADAALLTPAAADLAIVKTDSPDPVAQGGTLTYTLSVQNLGPNAAVDATVVDQLPSSVTFVSATPSQGTCSTSGRTVTCALGTLRAGATATITIVVTAPNADRVITNSAAVSSATPDPVTTNNNDGEDTTVGGGGGVQVDLSVTKADAPDPVEVGAPLVYTLVVENQGATTATDVTLVDQLPGAVTFVGVTTTVGSCAHAGVVVTCDLGDLAAAATATIQITVTAPGVAGFVTNNASVSAEEQDSAPGDNFASETTEVVAAGGGGAGTVDLTIVKQDSADPVEVGVSFVYFLTVGNDGTSTATGVQVTDTLPAGLTIEDVDTTQGSCVTVAPLVTCDLGSLAPAAVVTVSITVTATGPGDYENVAAVSGNENEVDPPDNSDDERTAVVAGGVGEGPLPIPTLGQWGLALLGLLLAAAGALRLRRRT